jgi:hypothetical protein
LGQPYSGSTGICALTPLCQSSSETSASPLADDSSSQTLNRCEFSIAFDLDRKSLPVAHSTELKVSFCAKLRFDILETIVSDDSLRSFTGDRSQSTPGLIWDSKRCTVLR